MGWSKNVRTCVPAFGMSVLTDFQTHNNDIGENIDFCCCEPHLCLCPTQFTHVKKYELDYYVYFHTFQMESRRMASL